MPTIEEQIAALTTQGASTMEAVKELTGKLNSPRDPQRMHAADDGTTVAYWEPARGRGRRKSMITANRGETPWAEAMLPNRLPKGYKNDVFKTLGGFIKEGWTGHKSAEWQAKHASVYKAIQGMSEQVATDGGFLVLPEFSEEILEKVQDNDLYSKLDHYTVSGNNMTFPRNAETSRANGSRAGGLRGYWVGEGGTITSSKPTFSNITLQLKKLAIIVYLTQELIEDAGQSLEQYVTKKAADEFNFMIGDAIINGTGAGQPLGILSAGCLLSVAKESGQAAATIVTENVDKMFARRWAQGTYTWYTNQDTHPQLSSLQRAVGTAGELVYSPPGGVSAAPYASLKGQPIKETEFNATLGTQGDLILADLGEIIAISKGGITQASSMHVEFLTDQMALRFTQRLDFKPWESTALTPFKGSNTQSSFVTLDTRS